jgi:hypothetical protein
MSIGSDTAQSRPADALEYTAAAGAAAYIIGNDMEIASIEGTYSCTRDVQIFGGEKDKLSPGMQDGKHEIQSTLFFSGMYSNGNASSVVLHGEATVFMNCNRLNS